MNIQEIFSTKRTENGDIAFDKVGNDNLLNILFLTEYYQKHLDEVHIGTTDRERLFSMFIRDPRFGLGKRDLGRSLMHQSDCSIQEIVKAGRVDDLFIYNAKTKTYNISQEILDYLKQEIENGNELVKKWMPRYRSRNLLLARQIAAAWGMNKQKYGHFIKCDTTEQHLSRKHASRIEFEHVPSLAMLKYFKRFKNGTDTRKAFEQYLEDVKSGKKSLNVSTSTVYDIYRNRKAIDPDLFFDKIDKIAINCIPVVDTSGSMCDENDSIGKALSIGHYLAKCSTFMPNKVVTFSSNPVLLTLGEENMYYRMGWDPVNSYQLVAKWQNLSQCNSAYEREIESMKTGDYTNTDFGKVMELFSGMERTPEYLVVLSDMEFDCGSINTKDQLEALWKEKGYTTKIVWWNLNSRNITVPEMDNRGNIYLSGYSPMLLKFLEVGFDGNAYLEKLLAEYKKAIG